MTRSLRIITFVALLLALAIGEWSASDATVSAQTRLRRAPERDLESTPLLPSGTRVLPPGTIIILEMETRLASNTSRVSDRFRAQVASPVSDEAGRTIIPQGIVVEGHVSAVKKAKWGHRSGYVAIVFDNFRAPDGRSVPVRATLTSSDSADRRRLDEEGYIKGGNPTRRDIIFIGGGAGAGAAIGAFTGGMLVGGGIGAAAGLTATLLLKGKDAVVQPGQRFGMELVQQLDSDQFILRSVTPIPRNTARAQSLSAPSRPIPVSASGNSAGPLDPMDITAERAQDGTVRLRINAQTPAPGWRVYTQQDVLGSVARVRLRGTPTSRSTSDTSFQATSIAPAPEIYLPDRGGALRRAEILGRNGAVRIVVEIPSQVGSRFARAQPIPVTQPIPVRQTRATGTNPGIYQPINPPYYNPETGQPATVPSSSTSGSASMQNVINQVEVIRLQYAGELGYLREPNGNFRFIGARTPSQDQKQLLDSLGALLTSLTSLRANASDPLTMRNSAQKVQEDARNTQALWQRVPLSADLNRKWSSAYQDIGTLLNSTAR